MSHGNYWEKRSVFSVALIFINVAATTSAHYQPQQCSNRLENALEHMVRRNRMKSGSRTYLEITPYSVYHSLYGEQEENVENVSENTDTILSEKLDNYYDVGSNDRKNIPITRVEVADLRVRLPQSIRWVLVDKCHFNASNRTLDTRLMFPDLSISGKIILHPLRGKCNMILRLRHAGIEFRTISLTSNEDSRRSGVASVRTDSHFSEPGFLSVFAHGCQGPTGQKFRKNSKRRHIDKYNLQQQKPEVRRNFDSFSDSTDYYQRYDDKKLDKPKDYMNFNEKILDLDTVNESEKSRTFTEIFGPLLGNNRYQSNRYHQNNHQWHNAESTTVENEEVSEALTRELEHLFSMGVRGLLTTYMQKALQPAIKETLMENMGYTLSYG